MGTRGSDGVRVGAGCWLGQRGRPLHSKEEGGNVLSPVAGHLKGRGLQAPRAFLRVQPSPGEQGGLGSEATPAHHWTLFPGSSG